MKKESEVTKEIFLHFRKKYKEQKNVILKMENV